MEVHPTAAVAAAPGADRASTGRRPRGATGYERPTAASGSAAAHPPTSSKACAPAPSDAVPAAARDVASVAVLRARAHTVRPAPWG
ncbi:hypothetical protein ACJ6WF_02595 [Streptomyces sp. MMS24-I2-30]|uniref:hypothetical protein n=1 Tax=Streptomyces sp. MMS24-I2-30 TaxID=3351564 RepID=UPI003896E2F8